ncbi:MAG TPA: thioredoxin family protein [Phycisphaerae bacterium]|jgi:small redox-active disulfide protein 2|nr:thioredoxin family protein [Phycisphaerae bacterium]
MKIEVLGTGCKKCNMLEAATKAAADKLGIQYELLHVKDLGKIAAYGVMMTPALVINGQVKVSGKVPSEAELTSLLTSALAK